MKLSKRLLAIAKIIEKHSNHGPMADIGSDHGYLPVWLVQNEIVDHAAACDIADGPLQACLSTVQLSHTEDKISVKKGDGLEPILHQSFDIIAICGMGGNLICNILNAHLEDVFVNTLVIEANVNEPLVRSWLNKHHWKIVDETIIEDLHHYYEVIVATKGEQCLKEKEIFFGPILMKTKGNIFKKKWQWQLDIHQHILDGLDEKHEKYANVLKERDWILEVLYENQ